MSRWMTSLAVAVPIVLLSRQVCAQPADETCVTAYEQSQVLMRQGSLLRGRAEMRLCKNICPTPLALDCEGWLADVTRQIPSVRVSAVWGDGSRVPRAWVPVRAVFPVPAAPLPPPVARPAWSYVLMGIGGAGVIIGAGLGVAGHVDRSRLLAQCAPACDPADVEWIRRVWVGGGISAGAGLVLAGAGLWGYLSAPASQPSAAPPRAMFAPVPLKGGAGVMVLGVF